MSEENKRSIRISVRNLVEFVLRSGDIDNRRSGNAQKDAMLAGGRIHRKIQKRMGSGYRAEVLRELAVKLSRNGKREEIKQLIEKYGVKNITAVAESDLDSFYADLQQMEVS